MAKFELKGKYTDGTDWTAGTFDVPTSLPNHMSLEKPTTVDVSMNGSEVTYSGVAEFESGGAIESGEYHEVKESPLLFISMGLTGNASVGNYFNFSTANFNRTPHIREKCFFITRQSVDNSVVAWTGMCTEIAGSTVRFQVLIVQKISDEQSTKKYQHNVRMGLIITGVNIEFVCQITLDTNTPINSMDSFVSAFVECYGKDTFAPFIGHYNIMTSKTFFYYECANYLSLTNKIMLRGYKINYNTSPIDIVTSLDNSLTDIVGNWIFNDVVIEL